MIRIDEIYTTTIQAWIQRNRPDLRLLYLDPFGRTDPASIHVDANNNQDRDYVLFFDQEPIQPEHDITFDHVYTTINADFGPAWWYEQTRGLPRPQ